MSAALTAGRALLDAVIINAETPRNAVTTASHGFLTRDGAHPTEVREIAIAQLEKYPTVDYITGTVTSATTSDNRYNVQTSLGDTFRARRLIVATGHTDDLSRLDLAGIEDVYGKSVYPCIFCDGFEHHHQRLAIIGREDADHYAPMARLWTDDLAVFTNGADLAAESRSSLAANNVTLHTDPIRRIESEAGQLHAIVLETGKRIERDVAFLSDNYSHPATRIAEELGVPTAINDWGMEGLDADAVGKTAVHGLYVIGDARTGFSGLIASAAEGAACAEAIVHDIATERWATA